MIPVRAVPTNDTGSGTDGSVFDNAFFQDFQDKIDASVQRVLTASTVTGAQNNYAPVGFSTTSGQCTLPWNGAADATFSGFAAGINGQRVTWFNLSATKVAYFKHLSGLSASGKQFSNVATSGDTPIAAGGSATFEYDTSGGTGVWRLIAHEQGDWIDYSATSTIVGWSAFTVKNLRYKLEGRKLSIAWSITGTSNSTTTSLTFPFTASSELDFWQSNSNNVTDNGVVSNTPGAGFVTAATSILSLARDASSTAWTASGSKVSRGQMMVGVS